MVFELLNPELQKVVKKRFKEPTIPQQLAIEPILEGKNILLIAATGTGKTESCLLPLFNNILDKKPNPISILYITPLRALNRDMLSRVLWWCNELDIEASVRHGDTTQHERRMQVEFPPQLLITTPETLQAILPGKKIREHLRNVKWVVIDEVHELVDSKRGIQLSLALERLRELCGDFQVAGLSATVGSPEEVAKFISPNKPIEILKAITPKAMKINVVSPKPEPKDKAVGERIFTSAETAARIRAVMDYIEKARSVLTFTNTREFAEILSSRIKTLDRKFPIGIHHSSLSKDVRIKTEREFKEEKLKSIICISGDSRILLADGSWRSIDDILKDKLKVISLNSNLKLEQGNIKTKVIERGKLKVVKVVTKHGFELECTKEHRFLTIDDGSLEWVKVQDLKIGQAVAIARRNAFKPKGKSFFSIIPDNLYVKISDNLFNKIKQCIKDRYNKYEDFSKETGIKLSVLRYFLAGKKTNQVLRRLKKIVEKLDIELDELFNEIIIIGSKNYSRHMIPKKISPQFCRLIGFLLADGTITRKNVLRLFNKNRNLLVKYKNILKSEFNIDTPILNGPNVLVAQCHATWLCNVFENIGIKSGRKARIVEMPKIIFQLPKKHQLEFLGGYFDGDGCFQNFRGRTYSILFTTYSKKMAQDLQLLLLSLGIVASIRHTKKKDDYVVAVIGGEHLRKFIDICKIWKDKTKLNISYYGYSNKDTIPSIGKLLKSLRLKAGMSTYFMQMKRGLNPYKYEAGNRTISRRQLLNLIKIYSKYQKNICETLRLLATSDIFWDSIKKIEGGKICKVFDILNTKNSNFIANGFIIHNCTSSLQLGIDIGAIDLVLQYQSPRQVSQAIQRVGRSGHELERVSKGIIITTDEDDIFESAVIARKALAEELEPIKFFDNSFDVLAHQIVGLTMDVWNIELEKAYQIVKRAYPYRNLQYAEFLEVCKQMQQLGLLFLNGGLKKKTVGLQYYFGNLSTIPDSLQYHVFNMIDNSFVGVLDEEFIALHGEVGSNFIIKGDAWRIVDITENKVQVEPTVDIEAAIPGWEGELMPVPFAVAQEVGKLRKIIADKLKKLGEDKTDFISKELQQLYPIDENSAKKIIKLIKKQMECCAVPDDRTILVEDFENMVVLHTCFGSSANETLGRFLSAMLTNRLGSVGFKCDPYRIMLQLQVKNVDLVKEVLTQTKPELLRSYLEMSLTKSNLFEWKFVHVAKRFGAIERGAQYGKVRMGKIIDSYVGSPIYKETLNELEVEKLDVETATELLKQIQSGDIKLIFRSGELSPLGSIGVKRQYAEVIGPEKPNKEIFEMFKHRLLNTKVKMVCVNCGQWQQTFVVKELPKNLKCKKCDAKLLGVTRSKSIDMGKIVKKKIRGGPLTAEEQKRFERLIITGDMFLCYEICAVKALAGKGIGPKTAQRILAKYYKTEDDFLRAILEAERAFIRTRKYWKT